MFPAAVTLGIIGGTPLFAHTTARIAKSEQSQHFFEGLSNGVAELKDMAPDITHEYLAKKAQANGMPTVYVNGTSFLQVVMDNGVKKEEIDTAVPGLYDKA